jgi:hypothetical protein
VLALSDETEDLVGAYLEHVKLPFPVAAGSTTRYAYRVNAYPSTFLIGPDGNIAWKGHPSELTDAILERVLADVPGASPLAVPLEGTWAGRVADAAAQAAEGGLAAALDRLDALGADSAAPSEDERADARRLREAIEAHVRDLVEKARADAAARDWARVARGLDALTRELGSRVSGAPAHELLERLQSEEPSKSELAARRALDEALELLEKRGPHRARGQIEAVVRDYPGTKAADEARGLLAR